MSYSITTRQITHYTLAALIVKILAAWYLRLSCLEVVTAIDQWSERLSKLEATRGRAETIKWVKMARLMFTRAMCGSPLEPTTLGPSMTSKGFPMIREILDIIKGGDDPCRYRLALTLLSFSRFIKCKGEPNLDSVITPPSSNYTEFLCKDAEAVIRDLDWFEPIPLWKRLHLSTKAGPNSQSMLGSIRDLTLLPSEMWSDIHTLTSGKLTPIMQELKLVDVLSWDRHFKIPERQGFEEWSQSDLSPQRRTHRPYCISKLAIINDKEAKSRVIAIIDYWSQSALIPLHQALFGMLKKIRGDCTFNQASFFRWLPSKGPYYSFDLSSATDRFPVGFQEFILGQVFRSKEFAASWRRLLVNREFYVPWTGGQVKYLCGQPMGAYSSWAAFSLSHHVVVRIAARRAGLSPSFSDYALLGDDIVIANSKVAEQYLTILEELGVQVSPSKSHVSPDTYEFAKRWVRGGIEVSPAPLAELLKPGKLKWFTLASWVQEVEQRWCSKHEMAATRALFAELYTSFTKWKSRNSKAKGWARRLGYLDRLVDKAYSFYHLPQRGDSRSKLLIKANYLVHTYFDNVIGCNRRKFALTLMWEWLAEVKTGMIESAIKKQTMSTNDFIKEAIGLLAFSSSGMSARELLRLLPPVSACISEIEMVQVGFEKLRADFTSGREKNIVLDASSYRLGVDPSKLFTIRASRLVQYSNCTLLNKFSEIAKWYVKNRAEYISEE